MSHLSRPVRHGLVDQIHLCVHPVLVGTQLFPPADTHTALRLTESRAFGTGVVLLP